MFFISLPERQRSPAVHFVRRTVQRLVGLFIWFSAVRLWPIVFNVTVWSLFFALSMWMVHCTRGSLLFLCPTSGFRLEARFGADSLQPFVRRLHFPLVFSWLCILRAIAVSHADNKLTQAFSYLRRDACAISRSSCMLFNTSSRTGDACGNSLNACS